MRFAWLVILSCLTFSALFRIGRIEDNLGIKHSFVIDLEQGIEWLHNAAGNVGAM